MNNNETYKIDEIPSKNMITLVTGYFKDTKFLEQAIFTDGKICEIEDLTRNIEVDTIYVNGQKVLSDNLVVKICDVQNASYIIKVTYERIMDSYVITNVEPSLIGKVTKSSYLIMKESFEKNVLSDKKYNKNCSKNPFSIIEMFKGSDKNINKGISYTIKK